MSSVASLEQAASLARIPHNLAAETIELRGGTTMWLPRRLTKRKMSLKKLLCIVDSSHDSAVKG